MTKLTIATVSICNKDYNTLTINSINTITGPSSSTTSINFSVNNGGSNMMTGYRDTLVLTNPSSIEYNYLVEQLLSITGLTQSN
jgi:hypothetical protein